MSSDQNFETKQTRSNKATVFYELKDKKAVQLQPKPSLTPTAIAIQSPVSSPTTAEFRQSPLSSSSSSSPPVSPSPISTSTPFQSPVTETVAESLGNLHIDSPPDEIPAELSSSSESETEIDNTFDMATAPEGPLPPIFSGLSSDTLASDWLREVGRYADFKELTDARRLHLFKYLLRQSAADWLDAQPAETVDTVEHFIAALKARFEATDILKYKTAKDIFNRRQQPGETVDCYLAQLQKLAKSIGADESMIRFVALNGLRPDISAYVVRQQPTTLAEVTAAARLAELTMPAPDPEAFSSQLSTMETELRRLASKIDRCTTAPVSGYNRERTSLSPVRPSTPPSSSFRPAGDKRVTFGRTSYGSPAQNQQRRQQEDGSTTRCTRCGLIHKNFNYCPAQDPRNVCRNCGRRGHFKSMCYGAQRNQFGNRFGNPRQGNGN